MVFNSRQMILAAGMVGVGLLAWLKILPPVAPASANEARLQQARLSQPAAPPPEPTPAPIGPPTPARHTIVQGETLWDLARRHGTTVEAIMGANRITNPRTLQIGQELLIPEADSLASPTGPAGPMMVYEIRPGDTLLALAFAYGASLEAILTANPGLEPTLLQIGQQVLIPVGEEAEAAAAAGLAEIEHEVVAGDTPFALALKYGSSVEAILAANPGLEPRALQIGQTIVIPRGLAARKGGGSPSPATTEIISAGIVSLEEAVLALVNQERQTRELSPYLTDEVLTRVAREHAQDMVGRGYFSHTTPDGKDLQTRLREVGVERQWAGENIQRNTQPAGKTVQTALGWFMGSAPHRKNILHGHYARLGVGVVEGPPGWYTFVLVFAE